MLHIIVTGYFIGQDIDLNDTNNLQKLANEDGVVFVTPHKEPTFLREKLVKPLLDEHGCLPDNVYNDLDAVYHYEDGEYSFDYDFGFLQHKIPQLSKELQPKEFADLDKRLLDYNFFNDMMNQII